MFQRSIMVICDGNQIDYTKGFWDWGEKGFLSYSVLLEVWKHWNVNLFFQIIGGCYGNSENQQIDSNSEWKSALSMH